jgi:hypothetical protein
MTFYFHRWNYPLVMLKQYRWNRLADKGFSPREICLKLGLAPLDDA